MVTVDGRQKSVDSESLNLVKLNITHKKTHLFWNGMNWNWSRRSSGVKPLAKLDKMAQLNLKVLFCLATLTIQNSLFALSIRYASIQTGPKFLASTAVLNSEILKLAIGLALVYYESTGLSNWLQRLKVQVIDEPIDTLKICIPSLLYVIQNNLSYFGASQLDAVTYQVTWQLKILTTAVFTVIILRKRLLSTQWAALVMLLSGVVLVNLTQETSSPPPVPPSVHADATMSIDITSTMDPTLNLGNHFTGMLAVILACFLSGFAGVYFEKILKHTDNVSIAMRNVQLSICSIPFAYATYVFHPNQDPAASQSYFYGYDGFVWYLILLQATGGLLVAVVLKWADNLLKGFATSIGLILSCAISVILFEFLLTLQFVWGSLLVLGSVFLYNYSPKDVPREPIIIKVEVI